jgi:peroxiredoxin
MVSLFIQASPSGKNETEKKEFFKKIYQSYGKRDLDKTLVLIDEGLKKYGSLMELLHLKYNILMAQKDYAGALKLIDNEIKKSGETEEFLSAKYNILLAQGDLKATLQIALKKDKIAKIKSPWDSMNIMHVYLQLGRKDDVFDWLNEAVKRGFYDYWILRENKYALIQNDKRFYAIIESIKANIGLGYPVKDFSVKLTNGEDYAISWQKGKIVLVVFWATWCEPCKKDLQMLLQYYNEFKTKGFDIVGISLDSSESIFKEFVSRVQLPWKMAYSGLGWKDPVVKLYGISSIPSYWLVDKKGVLRSFNVKGEDLRGAIAQLVAE